jgi:hypothetical protein
MAARGVDTRGVSPGFRFGLANPGLDLDADITGVLLPSRITLVGAARFIVNTLRQTLAFSPLPSGSRSFRSVSPSR